MTIRDLLMQLATTSLFRARWTREIQDEWVRNLLQNRPELDQEKLARTKDLVDQHHTGTVPDQDLEPVPAL